MQELDKLWEYQQIDLEADHFERDLRGSEDYKKFVKMHKFMSDQRVVLQRMTEAADGRRQQIETERKRYALLEERYNDGLVKLEKIDKEDLAEVERFRDYFENLQNRLATERREFGVLAKQLEKEDSQLNNMRNQLAKARKDYDSLKASLDDQRQAFAGDEKELRIRAAELEKNIDPAVMARYKEGKKSYVAPLANVRDGRCTGCSMELSAVLLRKLRDDDGLVDCENCGRLLRLTE